MGISRHNQKNRPILRRQIWTLGGKKLPPKILASLVDSEFDVDYDFATYPAGHKSLSTDMKAKIKCHKKCK